MKPVVGRLSQNALRVDEPGRPPAAARERRYTNRYARIAALAGCRPDAVHGFLAEELLDGDEVTLEGYVHGGRVTTIGVTDSVKYPGTNSFERFEYPSSCRSSASRSSEVVCARVLPALGFDGGFFNVEFFVAPRRAGADHRGQRRGSPRSSRRSSRALHGRSTYDALFELACGDDPAWERGGPTASA